MYEKIILFSCCRLASFSLFADTEKNPSSATSNSPVEGESYTVPGVYVAGTGGKQAGEMTSKGIKFRLNQKLADESLGFRFDVNEGYTIKKIDFCGHSNNSSSKATISKIVVDGTDLKLAAVELPVNTSSVKFSTGDIAATTAIELYVAEGSYTQAKIGEINYGCRFCQFKDICFHTNDDIVELDELTKEDVFGGEE